MSYSSPVWKISDEEFKNVVQNSKTYTEILAYFGLMNRGNNHKTLKKRINQLKLEFKSIGYKKCIDIKRKPISYFLNKGIKVTNTYLKKRLIKEKIFEDKCAICGQDNNWNGRYLSLHIDHKNGDSTDHRLENLRLLCPNCHSQTDNYCGKAKRFPRKLCKICGKVLYKMSKTCLCKICNPTWKKNFIKTKIYSKKPDKEELKQLIEIMPVSKIGEKYNVSGNAIKKWVKSYGLSIKYKPGDWAKLRTKMPPKEELEKLNDLSSKEIALIYKVCPDAVQRWFKKNNIKREKGAFWANKRWKNRSR
jgi:hypothetical protein